MSEHENLIERVIGRDAYIALCDWTGGINLYVPSSIDTASGQHLAEEIGQEAAEKLIQWAGGSSIAVPSRRCHEIKRRKRDVQAMRRRGLTVQEISRFYRYESRYTERQIYRLLNEELAEG